MSTLDSSQPCPNCGTLEVGPFCPDCGQPQGEFRRALLPWLREALEDVFSIEGRLARTLRVLFFEPGGLTRAWISGERARYTPPLRLYLVSSVAFFLTVRFLGTEPFAAGVGPGLGEIFDGPHGAQLAIVAEIDPGWGAYLEAAAEPYESWIQDLVTLGLLFGVPMTAVVLKAMFARARQWFVVDHVVHALHVISATLILWTVAWPALLTELGQPVGWTVLGVVLVYGAVSFHRVYAMTLAKTLVGFPVALILGSVLGGASLALVGPGGRLANRGEAAVSVWRSSYHTMAEDLFIEAIGPGGGADEMEAALRIRPVFDMAPAYLGLRIGHFAGDYGALLLATGEPEAVIDALAPNFDRRFLEFSVDGAVARAAVLTGDTIQATRLYRRLLGISDVVIRQEGTHAWMVDRYTSAARAWLARRGEPVPPTTTGGDDTLPDDSTAAELGSGP